MTDKNTNTNKNTEMKVNLPANIPILYTDSVIITSNEHGVVINIAQRLDDQNQQIVGRFGMSREHAKSLLDVLGKHLAMTTKGKPKQ